MTGRPTFVLGAYRMAYDPRTGEILSLAGADGVDLTVEQWAALPDVDLTPEAATRYLERIVDDDMGHEFSRVLRDRADSDALDREALS